jgi:hypothetical protein
MNIQGEEVSVETEEATMCTIAIEAMHELPCTTMENRQVFEKSGFS